MTESKIYGSGVEAFSYAAIFVFLEFDTNNFNINESI